MIKFAERLKQLRQSRGFSQQKLADILKISKSSINMYERGEREPGLECIEAIADLFNVDMDYLLGATDFPNKSLHELNLEHSSVTTELEEYLEHLRTRPEMKMLFSLTKDATKEDVEKAVKIIETMLGKD